MVSPLRASNPQLFYKLDPGEPGILQSASASQSQMAVTAQERHNKYRFEMAAALEGRIVVYSDISYRRSIQGSFAAIQAGHTTVISVAPSASPLQAAAPQASEPSQSEAPSPNAAPDLAAEAEDAPQATGEQTPDEGPAAAGESAQEEMVLRSERARIEETLKGATDAGGRADGGAARSVSPNEDANATLGETGTAPADGMLVQRLHEIDRQIRAIDFERARKTSGSAAQLPGENARSGAPSQAAGAPRSYGIA